MRDLEDQAVKLDKEKMFYENKIRALYLQLGNIEEEEGELSRKGRFSSSSVISMLIKFNHLELYLFIFSGKV